MNREPQSVETKPVSASTLFWIFFRIACTSFGGFMAMISVVQNVVVERKRLMRHEEMLDGISLASLLPGPVAVNLVVYVGYRLRGALGALVSGIAAVLPSFVLIVLLSIAYFRWGQIPAVGRLFSGFIPAVTAIIVAAAWNMGRKSVTGWRELALAAAAAAVLLGIGGFFSTLGIILGAGLAGGLMFRPPRRASVAAAEAGSEERPGAAGDGSGTGAEPSTPAAPTAGGGRLHSALWLWGGNYAAASGVAPLLAFDSALVLKVFLTFAAMSLMLFGGAYVFIPLIQEIVVDGHGWVTQQEFIDAVAMGQITPGPVLVSAAFVGLKVAGLAGATAATLGIYLPSALLMVASSRALEWLRRSSAVQAALRGIRPAVVGMIFAAAVTVGATAPPVWISIALFVAALYVLLRWRVEAVWIIPPAGLIGLLVY
jgi:chromate transporter